MVLSHEEEKEQNDHPYWYGRIIGAFHAEVRHIGSTSTSQQSHHMEFLWIRWYGRDMQYRAGWKAKRLHRVGFVSSEDEFAFGFLNPKEIIRGAHLIPAFEHGRTAELLPPSVGRPPPFVRQSREAREAQKIAAATEPVRRRVDLTAKVYPSDVDFDYQYYYVDM